MKVTKQCESCGSEFTVDFKYRNKKYCNRSCYVKSGIKGKEKQNNIWETRKCIVCSNDFEVRKKQEKKICSDKCRKEWHSLPENIELRFNKIKEVSFQKHGDWFFKSEEFKNKSNETKINRYGTKNHMEVEEIRNKQLDKIHNRTKESWIVSENKRKETSLKKYDDEYFNNREKFKETLNNKYGGHHLRLSEFIEKSKNTSLLNNGVEFPFQIKGNYVKAINAQKKKYDGLYVNSEEYKIIVKNNRLKKAKEYFEKNDLIFIDYVDDSYATIQCKTCNHIFTHTQVFREYDIKCRKCFPIQSDNSLNKFMENLLLDLDYIKNDRVLLNRKEIDYLLTKLNIGFEINGNYFHSENGGGKLRNYHIEKTIHSNEKNIKLIQIFEDEIKQKPLIVASRINNLIGRTEEKIFARKCLVKIVSSNESNVFLENNHIQGKVTDKIRIGLFYNDTMVSLMTFGKKRLILGNNKTEESSFELLRFCNKLNINVVGGFSKLLKYFIKNYQPKLITTYADIRWSGLDPNKTVYSKNGFEFIQRTPPNYWYVETNNYLTRKHRFNFRKDKLIKFGNDFNKTEWEIMKENNFDRIWDCGSLKFQMKI
jgi:hypothetical protein